MTHDKKLIEAAFPWGAINTESAMRTRAVLALAFIVVLLFVPSLDATAQDLLLFGGEKHDQFLGCLTCSSADPSSVWSRVGEFGNRSSSTSIWNPYGEYGSKYSHLSPWNRYSSQAPVIVDREGSFYGYFTANKYQSQRTKIDWLVKLLEDPEWTFENLDEIRGLF